MMQMSVSHDQPMDGSICQTQGAGGQLQQDMEVASNPAYSAYMLERSLSEDNNGNPHSQHVKRHDPVYLTSMATHGVGQQQYQQVENHQQQYLELPKHQQQQNQVLTKNLEGFVTPNI